LKRGGLPDGEVVRGYVEKNFWGEEMPQLKEKISLFRNKGTTAKERIGGAVRSPESACLMKAKTIHRDVLRRRKTTGGGEKQGD